MDIFLIKLLIAHVLGDFFLQPDSWVKSKERQKLKSPQLYLHVLIHGILSFILIAERDFLVYALILMLSHGVIDSLKLIFQKDQNKRTWFFIDQLLHILAIHVVWYVATNATIDFTVLNQPRIWVYLLGVLTLTYPSSIVIKVLIAKWTPSPSNGGAESSLQSAGKYIGIMERLLVFIFVCFNHFEAIGFLIAAKSIFRFGDLKEGNDLKLTEYILIGTLLSFGLAIVISLVINYL